MIAELIKVKLRTHQNKSIIVWYDAGGTLEPAVSETLAPERKLLRYEGSILALRLLLENADPNFEEQWLVYIPHAPAGPSLLKDWELFGVRLELDFLSLLHETSQLNVDQDLRQLFRGEYAGNARALVTHWNRVMANQQPHKDTLIKALLSLALGLHTFSLDHAILGYISEGVTQNRIQQAGLGPFWLSLLQKELGLAQLPQDHEQLREHLSSVILLTELVEKSGQLAESFSAILPATARRTFVSTIAESWRNNSRWQSIYQEQADKVEHKYRLRERLNVSERLISLPTYLAIDKILLQEAESLAGQSGTRLRANREKLKLIAQERAKLFWSSTGAAPWWEPIYLALQLYQKSEEALSNLEQMQQMADLVDAYAAPEGWWQLDYCTLRLAHLVSRLSPEQKERFVKPAFLLYREYLDKAAKKMAVLAGNSGWQSGQPQFWAQHVTAGSGPTAVFLIDALRYDLAQVLKQDLVQTREFDAEIAPILSVLPGVTETAMAALLPGAENGVSLKVEAEGLQVALEGTDLSSKAKREAYLKKVLGRNTQVLNLSEAEELQELNSPLTVLTWGDIDRFGTFTAHISPDTFFGLLKRLQRLICRLRDLGCRRFILASDHGFLFFPEDVELPERIDPPHGENVFCKHRFAAGRFSLNTGTWETTAGDLGWEGESNYAFPVGITIFGIQGETPRFLHGGLSLQEAVVPVLAVQSTALPKVGVTMDLPQNISSATVRFTLKVVIQKLFDAPRRVKVEITAPGLNLSSEEIELSSATTEHPLTITWSSGLSFDQTTPEKLTFKLIDANTLELLEQKEVPVTALFS